MLHTKAKERWATVKQVIEVLQDREFTIEDIKSRTVGYSSPRIASTLEYMEKNGVIERCGRQERASGGTSLILFRKVKKLVVRFEPMNIGGVWKDLYMNPLPVPKGRVHVCHG